MMIVFSTPTELDFIALRTFGLSVKESEDPIGRFGTGLKYAVAVLIRTGAEVSISAGEKRISIRREERNFRDQTINFIVAEPENEPAFDLSFTESPGS